MEGLQPGEALIKDSGMFPVAWSKSAFSTVNGKLILTNQRLVFAAGRFQNPIEGLGGAHKERVELSLGDIVSVDKGMMATVKVTAGQEYTFKGMRNAKEWVDLIIRAVRDAQTAPPYAPPQPAYQPPPPAYTPPPQPAPQPAPAAQRGLFCTECGSPLDAVDKFCGSCGKRL
ncbi:zinc ribbon domain-containing protein [Candidatus Bathyarchaeota archaeon]|nr:zinc ribbon domain-containing protein [Candidatus Bathyarchaeota archaeon]MBL7079517.1 zinc ribbon domain-containing protein [Candidatus Bathyarchaeota archaeon]